MHCNTHTRIQSSRKRAHVRKAKTEIVEDESDLASGDPEQRTPDARIHGLGNPHLVPHELTDRHRPLRLPLARTGTRTGARALPGPRTGRFQAERLLHLASGGGSEGSLHRRRVRRVVTRRLGGGGRVMVVVAVVVGAGAVGNGAQRLPGGCPARGDEDLVGG